MQNKMREDNNNMDRIFREKLGDFQQQPPEEIWDGIKAGMGNKPRRKILIPLWQAAAGFALIITAGSIFYLLNRTPQDTLAKQNLDVQQSIQTPSGNLISVPADSKTESAASKNAGNEESNSTVKSKLNKENTQGKISYPDNKIHPEVTFAGTISEEKNSETEVSSVFPGSLMTDSYLKPVPQDEIPRNKKTYVASWDMLTAGEDLYPEDSEINDRLLLTAQVSPTYSYRDIGNIGAGGSEQFNEYESGKVGYSGGLQFGYKTSKRLSIHVGMMYAQLGYNIENVERYSTNAIATGSEILSAPESDASVYAVRNSIGTINPKSSGGYFIGENNAVSSEKDGLDYVFNGVNPERESGETPATIEQNFQYLEVPFLLRYKIIDRKFGFNLLGGVSSNILVDNDVYLTIGDEVSDIGGSRDIKNFNYMGNVGLGFDYELGRNILFTFEPQFKYFLNSINQSNLITNRPYMIGLYTGVKLMW
jgi:hypothetical protein